VHPEVELNPGILAPDQEKRYRGREGVEAFLRATTDPWDTIAVEPVEMIEGAGDRVLVVDRWRFGGRDGMAIDETLFNLFTFRDGLIVRIDGFTDRDAALEAIR
jgi:ketosteroid isomerase-like protein